MKHRHEIVLYTRSGCHLCDVAKSELLDLRSRGWPIDVVEHNIDSDPELADIYGEQVPVGEIGGRKVFKYRVDVAKLETALRSREEPR